MNEWIEVLRGLTRRNKVIFASTNNHYGGYTPETVALFKRLWSEGANFRLETGRRAKSHSEATGPTPSPLAWAFTRNTDQIRTHWDLDAPLERSIFPKQGGLLSVAYGTLVPYPQHRLAIVYATVARVKGIFTGDYWRNS